MMLLANLRAAARARMLLQSRTSTAKARYTSTLPARRARKATVSEVALSEQESAVALPDHRTAAVERAYQKKTPIEHVLLRPGMYIGSTELHSADHWVYDDLEGRMVRRKLLYNPGLLKIFDEILVNACDNRVRDPTMKRLDVEIGQKPVLGSAKGFSDGRTTRSSADFITVRNDGRGIPVEFHSKEGMYVPELVLGNLLTGSNFDSDASPPAPAMKTTRHPSSTTAVAAAAVGSTGGRHGYGAKLTNIFSGEFIVETVDTLVGKRYRQTWRDNMQLRGDPVITACDASDADFTRVSFAPDLARFYHCGNETAVAAVSPTVASVATTLSPDIAADLDNAAGRLTVDAGTLALMRRRALDAAGTVCGIPLIASVHASAPSSAVAVGFTPRSESAADDECAVISCSTTTSPLGAAPAAAVGSPLAARRRDKGARAPSSNAATINTVTTAAARTACEPVVVTLNGAELPINSFAAYAALFTPRAAISNAPSTALRTSDRSASTSTTALRKSDRDSSIAVERGPISASRPANNDGSNSSGSGADASSSSDAEDATLSLAEAAQRLSKLAVARLPNGWDVAVGVAGLDIEAMRGSSIGSSNAGLTVANRAATSTSDTPADRGAMSSSSSSFAAVEGDSVRPSSPGTTPTSVARESSLPPPLPSDNNTYYSPPPSLHSTFSPAVPLPSLQQHQLHLADVAQYNDPSTVSFVNSIHTPRGGTHVALFNDALSRRLVPLVQKRAAATSRAGDADIDAMITPSVMRDHFRVILSARVPDASFDSQSKEALVTPISALLSPSNFNFVKGEGAAVSPANFNFVECLPDKFIRAVAEDLGVANAVISALRSRARAEYARGLRKSVRASESKVKSIPKLEDANLAGGPRAHECTLILTEGDSAKALAVAGLAVVGRDTFGVFPLKGKLLNVRDLSPQAALDNTEISALVRILGLDFTQSYEGAPPHKRPLRYGRVMVMADQDVDGAHIKGLIINLFHTFWPKLLDVGSGTGASSNFNLRPGGGAGATASSSSSSSSSSLSKTTVTAAPVAISLQPPPPPSSPSFLEQFITPIIKARRASDGLVREFYSVREFEKWRAEPRQQRATSTSAPVVNDHAQQQQQQQSTRVALPDSVSGSTNRNSAKRRGGPTVTAKLSKLKTQQQQQVQQLAAGFPSETHVHALAPSFAPGEASIGRWTFKYYKGLGTSTSAEGRAYFRLLTRHRIPFLWGGEQDGSRIEMAFAKAAVEQRKAWLTAAAVADAAAATAATVAAVEVSAQHAATVRAALALDAHSLTPTLTAAGAGDITGGGVVSPSPAISTADSTTAASAASVPRDESSVTAAAAAAAATPSLIDSPSFAAPGITFSSFIDSDLVEFSRADLVRSIPSLLDGLKPAQRKILYACFRRAGKASFYRHAQQVGRRTAAAATTTTTTGAVASSSAALEAASGDGLRITTELRDINDEGATPSDSSAAHDTASVGVEANEVEVGHATSTSMRESSMGAEVKVAQLAGYVSEHTAYHHGESSLVGAIVRMAQDFVGANNIPLLQPLGQFGTRLQGGKDAASARYIFTRLSPLSRALFPSEDDDLLKRRDDDGQPVEPVSFVPVIPLVLINGAEGIGTGWATFVPQFHPLDVIDALLWGLKFDAPTAATGDAAGGGPSAASSSLPRSACASLSPIESARLLQLHSVESALRFAASLAEGGTGAPAQIQLASLAGTSPTPAQFGSLGPRSAGEYSGPQLQLGSLGPRSAREQPGPQLQLAPPPQMIPWWRGFTGKVIPQALPAAAAAVPPPTADSSAPNVEKGTRGGKPAPASATTRIPTSTCYDWAGVLASGTPSFVTVGSARWDPLTNAELKLKFPVGGAASSTSRRTSSSGSRGGASGSSSARTSSAAFSSATSSSSSEGPVVNGFAGSSYAGHDGDDYDDEAAEATHASLSSSRSRSPTSTSSRQSGTSGPTNFNLGAVRITELPIGRWTEDYKLFLLGLVERGLVRSVSEFHTEARVDFRVLLGPEGMRALRAEKGGLEAFFKLSTTVSTRNMHLFNAVGDITRYTSPFHILAEFAPVRLALYAARRARMVAELEIELFRARAKVTFLRDVVSGTLRIGGVGGRVELSRALWALGHAPIDAPSSWIETARAAVKQLQLGDDAAARAAVSSGEEQLFLQSGQDTGGDAAAAAARRRGGVHTNDTSSSSSGSNRSGDSMSSVSSRIARDSSSELQLESRIAPVAHLLEGGVLTQILQRRGQSPHQLYETIARMRATATAAITAAGGGGVGGKHSPHTPPTPDLALSLMKVPPPPPSSYDFLINLPIASLTADAVARAQLHVDGLQQQLAAVRDMTPAGMWAAELRELRGVIASMEEYVRV